jgi:alkanesulfonate monooxygenase SsuD/methylene tetrahydromethanopterin reductase-like flavin-dependent oxidoreductase (luciferase family)
VFLAYFTEQPMSAYPEVAALTSHPFDHPAREAGDSVLLFSNRFFDPKEGARLYAERMEEYREVERVGFDGIMVNEHHNGPFCMQPRCNVTSAMLTGLTERVKIVQLGNPIPTWDNPVQLAEETAMIDMMSGGRLVAGIVRGGGNEQFANNTNPAFNRERFEEGHDLMVKAWTQPGPFRWEGNHYQLPVVNPWAVPLQDPHPRVWVPGVTSLETIIWAAEHRYPYVCLNTSEPDTLRIWKVYGDAAERVGYKAGEDLRGYLMRCHVQDDEELARTYAAEFEWMRGEFTGMSKPWLITPAGYSSVESRLARLRMMQEHALTARAAEEAGGEPRQKSDDPLFEAQIQKRRLLNSELQAGSVIAGTPKQAIERIRRWLEATRPSILFLWGNDGKVPHEDAMRCIQLLGEEVIPAVREIGEELGIHDPFDLDSPVSLATERGVPTPDASDWALTS